MFFVKHYAHSFVHVDLKERDASSAVSICHNSCVDDRIKMPPPPRRMPSPVCRESTLTNSQTHVRNGFLAHKQSLNRSDSYDSRSEGSPPRTQPLRSLGANDEISTKGKKKEHVLQTPGQNEYRPHKNITNACNSDDSSSEGELPKISTKRKKKKQVFNAMQHFGSSSDEGESEKVEEHRRYHKRDPSDGDEKVIKRQSGVSETLRYNKENEEWESIYQRRDFNEDGVHVLQQYDSAKGYWYRVGTYELDGGVYYLTEGEK